MAAYLTERFQALWPYRARVRFHAPAERIAPGVSPVDGMVEAVNERTCVLTLGGSDPQVIASFLCMFAVDFELVEGEEVAAALHEVANRCTKAVVRM